MAHTVDVFDQEHVPWSEYTRFAGGSDLAGARETDHELAAGFWLLGMAAACWSSSE